MVTLCGFLWHVSVEALEASEGSTGSYCQSAQVERATETEAREVLESWILSKQESCQDKKCEHTPIIVDKITPKMILSGMTANMVNL